MNRIFGTNGDDNVGWPLWGGDGNDILRGYAGDDWFRASFGDDVIIGDAGVDNVFYESMAGVRINNTASPYQDIAPFTAIKTGVGVDLLVDVEALHGSGAGDLIVTIGYYVFDRSGDDTVIFTGAEGKFVAGSGADTFVSWAGDGWLSYGTDGFDGAGPQTRGVDLTMAGHGFGTAIDPWGFTDSFSGVRRVEGSAFDDVMRGAEGDDAFDGGDGDDTLQGGDGDDTLDGGLGDNRLQGGDGDDTITSRGDGDIVRAGDGDDTVTVLGPDATVMPGLGDDTIVNQSGDRYALLLRYEDMATPVTVDLAAGETDGAGFRDTFSGVYRVSGGDGDDILRGGWNEEYEAFDDSRGVDQIDGRGGFDELIYNIGDVGDGPITIDFGAGFAIDSFGGTDWFWNIEGVRATLGADTAIGSDQDYERYRMLAGDDTVQGGGGVDRVDHSRDANYGGGAGVTVDLAQGFAIDGWGDRDLLSGVEEARGTDSGDRLTGDGHANLLRGEAGADTLAGGGGADTLEGGDGGDQINGDAGADLIRGGDGGDALGGGDGADALDGGLGNDWLWGGAGSDAFAFSAATLQAGDVDRVMDMQENQATGNDWLRFDGVRYDQLVWYEQGTSAVVQIALDGGGSAYVEIMNFTLAQLGDQYYFV